MTECEKCGLIVGLGCACDLVSSSSRRPYEKSGGWSSFAPGTILISRQNVAHIPGACGHMTEEHVHGPDNGWGWITNPAPACGTTSAPPTPRRPPEATLPGRPRPTACPAPQPWEPDTPGPAVIPASLRSSSRHRLPHARAQRSALPTPPPAAFPPCTVTSPAMDPNRFSLPEYRNHLLERRLIRRRDQAGCTDAEIEQVMRAQRLTRLPALYRDFLKVMGKSPYPLMTGTDWSLHDLLEIKDAAQELLREDGADPAILEDALVMAMHQGYIVLYIPQAELAPDDPEVWLYEEQGQPRRQWPSFRRFLLSIAEAREKEIAVYKNLAATGRSRNRSTAAHTSPKPPRPSRRSSR